MSQQNTEQSSSDRLERLEKVKRASEVLRARLAAGSPARTLDEGAYRAYGWLCEALDEAKDNRS